MCKDIPLPKIAYAISIKLNADEFLFHAGTSKKNSKMYAIGGRVLNFVSLSDDFASAKKSIINNYNNSSNLPFVFIYAWHFKCWI